MDSIFEVLFVFIAIGGWIVQRLVKKQRQDAARAGAEGVLGVPSVDESVAGDVEDIFVPAVSAYLEDREDPDTYLEPPTEPRAVRAAAPPSRPAAEAVLTAPRRVASLFAGRSLRDAVIMSEVLRRPKGLR